MNYPLEDYIINFLARKESPEDEQKLKEWLAADPAHRDELKQWLAAWDTAGMMDVIEKIDTEKAYHQFMFRVGLEKTALKEVRKNHVFTTIFRIAAIFVICFALGVFFHYYLTKNQSEQIAFIENIVPLGSKSEIKLPDGSTVSLNAGSTLRHPTNYGTVRRDVYLSGEGYFKVTKQTQKPFTVHTALANITVLGTEFNVKAYPDDDLMETILIIGELAVEHGDEASAFDRTLLKPWQKLSIAVSDSLLVPVITPLDPDIAEAAVSWKERNWRIEGMTLQDLATQLERRYDVHITVDEQSKNLRFTGNFTNESLEEKLNIIQLSLPMIRFSINGKNVDIFNQ